MKVKILNRLTRQYNEMDLDVTEEQLARHAGGELAQNVFPHLTAGEREFLITGMNLDEQKEIYG